MINVYNKNNLLFMVLSLNNLNIINYQCSEILFKRKRFH